MGNCQGGLLDLVFQYAIISLFSCRLAFTWKWGLFRSGLSLASSSSWLEGVFWAPPIWFTLVDPSIDHETSFNRNADYSSPVFCSNSSCSCWKCWSGLTANLGQISSSSTVSCHKLFLLRRTSSNFNLLITSTSTVICYELQVFFWMLN